MTAARETPCADWPKGASSSETWRGGLSVGSWEEGVWRVGRGQQYLQGRMYLVCTELHICVFKWEQVGAT